MERLQKIFMKTIPLPNNLCVTFNDLTHRYFGDFHHVKIEISCQITLDDAMFISVEERADAVKVLGAQVTYSKVMERMGVPTAELAATQTALVDHFEKHAISYMSSTSFPARFIKAELAKIRKTPTVIPVYQK
jgi:hypothetical protein